MSTDYYKILRVNYNAKPYEIKKAYRKLALLYHPDKNPSDKNKYQKIFTEINEAYNVLSKSESRKRYDLIYKTKIIQKKTTISPHLFLEKINNIRKFIYTKGRNKISETALYKALYNLLSDNNLKFLLIKNEKEINEEIIKEVLKCCNFLTSQNMNDITGRLFILANENPKLNNLINDYIKHSNQLIFSNVIAFFIKAKYKITRLFR